MGGIFFAAHKEREEAYPTLFDTLERGVWKRAAVHTVALLDMVFMK